MKVFCLICHFQCTSLEQCIKVQLLLIAVSNTKQEFNMRAENIGVFAEFVCFACRFPIAKSSRPEICRCCAIPCCTLPTLNLFVLFYLKYSNAEMSTVFCMDRYVSMYQGARSNVGIPLNEHQSCDIEGK